MITRDDGRNLQKPLFDSDGMAMNSSMAMVMTLQHSSGVVPKYLQAMTRDRDRSSAKRQVHYKQMSPSISNNHPTYVVEKRSC